MTANDGINMMGLERLNALFAWWGAPNANGAVNIEGQIKHFEAFASDLQKTCSDAYSRQTQALITANERFARSLQQLMSCRAPQDFVAAESNILANLFEEASLRAATWAEVTRNVGDCCAALVRQTTAEIREQAHEATAPKSASDPEQPVARKIDKQQARA